MQGATHTNKIYIDEGLSETTRMEIQDRLTQYVSRISEGAETPEFVLAKFDQPETLWCWDNISASAKFQAGEPI